MCSITRGRVVEASRKAYDRVKHLELKFGGLDVRRIISADHRHTSKSY